MTLTTPESPQRAGEGEANGSVVEAWCRFEQTSSVLNADREAIEASRPLRSLIVAYVLREPDSIDRDLLHAFGALGRLLADLGASPTLVAVSVDALGRALPSGHGALAGLASTGRVAMVESYVHATVTAAQRASLDRWEYPACVVPVQAGLVAIAAGHPVDDEEALTAWASRVAQGVALSGARSAIVAGSEKAKGALAEALDLVGVDRLER